jgi:hypothetical protein
LDEDRIVTLLPESPEKAAPKNMNNSAYISKSDRKAMLQQVLLWTPMINCYLVDLAKLYFPV